MERIHAESRELYRIDADVLIQNGNAGANIPAPEAPYRTVQLRQISSFLRSAASNLTGFSRPVLCFLGRGVERGDRKGGLMRV